MRELFLRTFWSHWSGCFGLIPDCTINVINFLHHSSECERDGGLTVPGRSGLKLFCWILVWLQRCFTGCGGEHSESVLRASLHFITSLWRSAQHVTSCAAADWSDWSRRTVIKGLLWSELKPTSDPVSPTGSVFYLWKLPVSLFHPFIRPFVLLSLCSLFHHNFSLMRTLYSES